jgi:predicted ribosomally synthesized peptide with SipW-like signal peptide
MKKKLIALGLVVCMAALAIGGSTLAYFTDKDSKDNQFTTGSVDITLNETFVQNSQLIPGQPVEKKVSISVADTSLESYVWYTYTIPAELENVITASLDETNAAKWTVVNGYETVTENGKDYHVHTVLYNESVKPGKTTEIGMSKVTMNSAVDYDNATQKYTLNSTAINYDFTNGVEIEVTAYGIQAATFENVQAAYAAYTQQNTPATAAN